MKECAQAARCAEPTLEYEQLSYWQAETVEHAQNRTFLNQVVSHFPNVNHVEIAELDVQFINHVLNCGPRIAFHSSLFELEQPWQ